MVQKTITQLIDDIDGGEADETVLFSVDGVNYEIDLTSANAAKLRDSFATWIGHARRSSAGRRTTGRRTRSSGGGGTSDAAKVREWARANGYTVSDRGRIPAEVTEAYAKAN